MTSSIFQVKSRAINFLIFISAIVILAIISGCSTHPDLGNGYRFESDGRYTLEIVNFENTVMISSHILEYAYDSTFIIVSQRPWDSVPGVRIMSYPKSNRAMAKSSFKQYWILKKKEKSMYSYDSTKQIATYSNVYGPYQKDEYLRKREEFEIPKELKLKDN